MAGMSDLNSAEHEDVNKAREEVHMYNMYACFQLNDYPRCDEVASYFENFKRDITSAKKIYKNNCDDHDFARSCYNFGRAQFMTMKTRKDFQLAHEYFEKACRLGDKRSCFEAGRMLLDKYHPKRTDADTGAKALEYFEHGCNKVFEKQCCHAASEFYRAGHMDTKIDKAKALKYAERSCEYGDERGCINAHLMHKNGDGVAQNEEKAAQYMDMGIRQVTGNMQLVKLVSQGWRRASQESKSDQTNTASGK